MSIRAARSRLIKDPIISIFDPVEHIVDLFLARENVGIEQASRHFLVKTIVYVKPF